MYANLRPLPNRSLRHVRHWAVGALAYCALTAFAQNNQTATRLSLNNLFSATPGLTHIPVQGGGSVSLGQVSGGNVSTRIPLTLSTASTGPVMNGVLRANPGAILGTMEITAGARLPSGPGIPATVKVPVDGKDIGAALRKFAKRALPVVSTAIALKDLIDDVGLIPPDVAEGEWKKRVRSDGVPTTGTVYRYNVASSNFHNFESTMAGACNTAVPLYLEQVRLASGWTAVATFTQAGNGPNDDRCFISFQYTNGPNAGVISHVALTLVSGTGTIPGGSEERIEPASDAEVDQRVSEAPMTRLAPFLEEIVRQGEDVPAKSEPQLSGPSSVTNPAPTTSTTTGPNGQPQTTTQQQQRTNVTYNGNTYNTTTTSITNTTNNTTNETTTTTTENPEPSDPCEGNPNRAGCAELDVPEGEIPREEKNLTFNPVDLGVNATGCPAPIAITVPVVGQKFLEFDVFCDTATKMRPFIVACSALTAMFILSFALRV